MEASFFAQPARGGAGCCKETASSRQPHAHPAGQQLPAGLGTRAGTPQCPQLWADSASPRRDGLKEGSAAFPGEGSQLRCPGELLAGLCPGGFDLLPPLCSEQTCPALIATASLLCAGPGEIFTPRSPLKSDVIASPGSPPLAPLSAQHLAGTQLGPIAPIPVAEKDSWPGQATPSPPEPTGLTPCFPRCSASSHGVKRMPRCNPEVSSILGGMPGWMSPYPQLSIPSASQGSLCHSPLLPSSRGGGDRPRAPQRAGKRSAAACWLAGEAVPRAVSPAAAPAARLTKWKMGAGCGLLSWKRSHLPLLPKAAQGQPRAASETPLPAPAVARLLLAVLCCSSHPCPWGATKRRFGTRSAPVALPCRGWGLRCAGAMQQTLDVPRTHTRPYVGQG